jgi:hypothetical protein
MAQNGKAGEIIEAMMCSALNFLGWIVVQPF